MSDLSYIEKNKLEKVLVMEGGYVLDFSNRTLQEFVFESTGKDIYDSQYDSGSGSKANRLRAFLKTEPNAVVGQLISDLLQLRREGNAEFTVDPLYQECCAIAKRLKDAVEAYQFGPFILHPHRGTLTHNLDLIRLRPSAFRTCCIWLRIMSG